MCIIAGILVLSRKYVRRIGLKIAYISLVKPYIKFRPLDNTKKSSD